MSVREIKARAVLRGMTWTELAKKIGVSKTWLSLVLNGKKESKRVKREIAKALGLSYEEVWE